MWQSSGESDETQNQLENSIHKRSLWIALGVGTIYLLFGLKRTIVFFIIAVIAYLCSHPKLRERWLLPLWIYLVEWIDRWASGKRS